ncbi:hypothetical protein POM88_008089 [Heracleum sosnowskyi]|uniref:Endonuclease/exonuclease/phosphatase domain-containing protein n=1 Tax=Heracleum sosnowskyi TaxID=360622 RepID=A0AAD8J6S3_9APIA|nr:hypothetical protein POM88_008089 [Heracleum sosnowskyi]
MNALTWNCQGLGSPGKIQFLQEVTRSEKPSFVFLSETISSYRKMEILCYKLGFENFIVVEPQGKNGGIALFWKNADGVNMLSYSRSHIDVSVSMSDSGVWRLTDKRRGPPYPNYLIDGFNVCLQEAELHDLELTGHQFTWEKGKNTSQWTEIKLDRVLANS